MPNDEQAALWNDSVGDAWVRHADHYDATLGPFGREVMDRLELRPGDRVLDVGCGAGHTTLELASRVAPGEVLGVDLSVAMVDEAVRRAAAGGVANVHLLEADVQSLPLAVDAYDVAFSRFGVMFFSEPLVAFSHLAAAMVPGGRLGFSCFQGPAVNPFIVVPVLAAASHLDLAPMPDPGAPGPFSLADPDHTAALLGAAGLEGVTIEPGPDEAVLGGADDLEALATRVLEQNPATGPPLARAASGVRRAAVAAAARALGEHRQGDDVRMGAGTWIVLAEASR